MNDNLEYVAIPCQPITAKELHKSFFPNLPKEYFAITENEASTSLESEMVSILGSAGLFRELQRDCSLDNLFIDEEFRLLDEVLHVVPNREAKGLKPMRTLDALPRCRAEKAHEKHTLGIRNRFRRPIIDMSYLNSPNGCFDNGLPIHDVIFTVFVYRPIPFSVDVDCTDAPWKMVMEQRIEILGSNTLSALRDAIGCPQDIISLGDFSENLDNPDVHVPARAIYPSSYFFIEGVFYDDLRNPNATRLSTCVIEWQNNWADFEKEHYTVSNTEDHILGEIKLVLGKPYLFLHQGSCEHVIIFTSSRLTDRTCAQSASAYPVCTGRGPPKRLLCDACNYIRAQWLVHEAGEILPTDPCRLCITCLRYLLYTDDGKKIHPRFRVQQLLGYEFI